METELKTVQGDSREAAIQKLAQDFLIQLKNEQEVDGLMVRLSELDQEELALALVSDQDKKAFWINLYNGFNLYLMREQPEVNAQAKSRMKHFLRRQINVAGKMLSLMDLENGILRRSKVWWGLGYIPRFWTSSFEVKMRVEKLDARIHFALNCGAMSCPPIRFYSPDSIEEELDLATRSYLHSEVRPGKDSEENILYVSSLFRAYRADFRAPGGILAFIEQYKELPKRKWKIRFIRWDSTTDLDDFAPL